MTYEFEVLGEDIIAFRIYCMHHVPECRRTQTLVNVILALSTLASFVVVGLLRASDFLQIVMLLVTLFLLFITAISVA